LSQYCADATYWCENKTEVWLWVTDEEEEGLSRLRSPEIAE